MCKDRETLLGIRQPIAFNWIMSMVLREAVQERCRSGVPVFLAVEAEALLLV
jgi:hypothetical protein